MSTQQGESTNGIHVPTIEEVVSEHTSFVRTVLLRLHVRRADVDDVMQRVFLVVSRKLARFDPAQSIEPDRAILGLLVGICTRCAADHRRSVARRGKVFVEPHETFGEANDARETVEPESPTPDPETQLIAKEREVLLGRLLAEIPPDRRAIIAAYELEGASMRAIGTELGVSLNTCWNRRRLGLLGLRAAWSRQGKETRKGG